MVLKKGHPMESTLNKSPLSQAIGLLIALGALGSSAAFAQVQPDAGSLMTIPAANVVTEQLTAAGRAIEHDSFAVIDREVLSHGYTAEQWPIVRRLIHANADFDFNGLTDFHGYGVSAGVAAILSRATRVVADVEMICVGLSAPRLNRRSGMVPCC